MVFALLLVVLLESDVPGDGGDGRHGPELVYDVPGQEVDVIVVEVDARIANPVTTKLIQLRILHPLDTLTDRRFVQVQLVSRESSGSSRSGMRVRVSTLFPCHET